MIQGDTFEPILKPINKVDTIIHDPLLSEFKYHFIIKKLPIFHLVNDKIKWNELITSLYKGFNAPFMGHNSIHIVQILNVYPQFNEIDLIVGFRRDQHALKVYREYFMFEFANQKFQVQVAEGFKTYLDELNQKYRMETAQRQKLRALQSQTALKPQQVNPIYRSSTIQKKPFIRQVSNSISHIQESQVENDEQQQQQGQIVDSDNLSQREKISSNQSYSSKSSKLYPHQSNKNTGSNQFQIKNPLNREGIYLSRSNKKKRRSSSQSSRSYSSRSRSSSSPSYRRSRSDRNRERSSRDRHRNSYMKKSSSEGSSYSSQSQRGRHYNKQKYHNYNRGEYSTNLKRRSPVREYRNFEDRRQDENNKYHLPQSLNRVYSYNNDRNYQQHHINPQLNRKYSHEQQYRLPMNRNIEVHQFSRPSQSHYYKQNQDYYYNRQVIDQGQDTAKNEYRGSINRNTQNNYKGHSHRQ